jgi:hypothetical protein
MIDDRLIYNPENLRIEIGRYYVHETTNIDMVVVVVPRKHYAAASCNFV